MMQINNNFQKNANISMVAQLLWKSPGISRVEIARQLDLYRSTVSNIINTLIAKRIVFEEKEGSVASLGGRKPVSLALNEKFGCVIGLDLQPSGFHSVILNVFGAVLFSASGPFPDNPFEVAVESVLFETIQHIKKTGIPLLAICAGLPGIIDSGNGIIVRSDSFQLCEYEFASVFSVKYGVPVILENDANCLAWMELAHNRGMNLESFICINAEYREHSSRFGASAGMAIGMGIAIGGSVYSGSKHAAGEFISVSWRNGEIGQNGLSANVLKLLESDEKALTEWIIDLFTSVVPILSVLDFESVFLHGELARNAPHILKIVEQCVPQFNAFLRRSGCTIKIGSGSEHCIASGAALMFFIYLFSVPGASTGCIGRSIDWDGVFKLTKEGDI